MSKAIAIIGAGIAGLAAARQLRRSGYEPTIFEKSRGLGGRMATRRAGVHHFDHGAQYFTARGPRFHEMIEEWAASGCAGEWFEGAFVGTPAMTAPARSLADGVQVKLGCQVTKLSRASNGWSVYVGEEPDSSPAADRFAGVMLAMPAPQALALAMSAGVELLGLRDVRIAPCWALMLSFDRPLPFADSHIEPEHAAIAWIADNASKPGRAREAHTYVVHATPAWSREHLELSPEEAGAKLFGALQDLIGLSIAPKFMAAHRWRYARVEQPAGSQFLWREDVRLGACGDWCIGPRVESAFDSGEALALAMIETLGGRSGH